MHRRRFLGLAAGVAGANMFPGLASAAARYGIDGQIDRAYRAKNFLHVDTGPVRTW